MAVEATKSEILLEPTDEAIVIKVQQGDVEAFGTLMKRYEPKLLRYASKFLLGREDGEDIVQEVFLKAYANLRDFDTARRFSPWIYRIAHNEFIVALRRKSRDRLTFFDFDTLLPHPVAKEQPSDAIERQQLRAGLDQYLARIPTKYRETLILSYFEELNYQEIAETLHLPTSTVGVRLRRAKAMLKKLIDSSSPKQL